MSEESTTPAAGNGRIDWSAIVETHRRWLRTVVYSRVDNADAVEEVMQNVALAAIEQHPTLDDESKAPAWLYRVAVRQALLHRRKRGRDTRRRENYAAINGTSPANGHTYDPLRWLLADEERDLVRQALENLRPRDRELLLLKYTENWTCRQLAERLGIQVTAVETRLHRARARMRSELERLDIPGDER